MPANTTPIFPLTPVSTMAALSATANTSRAATSASLPTAGVLISPSSNTNGIRVDQIQVQGTGTTIAGIVVIWLVDSSDNATPIDEIAVTAITPNTTTTTAFGSVKYYSGFILAPNYKLYATSQVTSQVASVGMIGGAY